MSRILVVDNMPDVRATISGLLSDAGHAAQSASNEAEAIIAITQERFDFAVLDIRLHGDDDNDQSGLTLALALQRLSPHTRIIMATGFKVRPTQVVRAVRYLGTTVDFIEKTPDMATDILKTVIEYSQTSSESFQNFQLRSVIETTQFYLSLELGQYSAVRAHGQYVRGERTNGAVQVKQDEEHEYVHLADQLARHSTDMDRHVLIKNTGKQLWDKIFLITLKFITPTALPFLTVPLTRWRLSLKLREGG